MKNNTDTGKTITTYTKAARSQQCIVLIHRPNRTCSKSKMTDRMCYW